MGGSFLLAVFQPAVLLSYCWEWHGVGETKHVTITIEGKEEKVIFLLEAVENSEFKVKEIAERFEEGK